MMWTEFRALGKSRPTRQGHNFIFQTYPENSIPAVQLGPCTSMLGTMVQRYSPNRTPCAPGILDPLNSQTAPNALSNHQVRLPSSTLVTKFKKLSVQGVALLGYFGMIILNLKIVMCTCFSRLLSIW